MGISAAVAGASGYAGGELLRVLLDHPEMELATVAAGSHAGAPVTSVHPHLSGLEGHTFTATEADALAAADLAFLALPPGEAAAVAASLPPRVRVVDLGADHRLADADAWKSFYGTPHAGQWPYGLPELGDGNRATVADAARVANPGCYATAVNLALAPPLRTGLAEPEDLVVMAASGTTGAGRSPKAGLLASEVMGSMSAYKAGGAHQHIPEIEQALGEAASAPVRLSFTPMLAPMPRGILATCTARLAADASDAQLRDVFGAAYGDEPFVRVLPQGQWPRTADTLGSNAAHLQAAVDRHAGRVLVVCAIDNLGKGAAGQAVQNANLILGLDETTGLTAQGVTP